MRLLVSGMAAGRTKFQLGWLFLVLAPLNATSQAVWMGDLDLPPDSVGAVYLQNMGAKLSELQTAEGNDAARVCREVAALYHDWIARNLAVNYMLGELDPQGKTAISRDLWVSLIDIGRPEALLYLLPRIDQEHAVWDCDMFYVPVHFKFDYDIATYGADAADAIDRYIATADAPLSQTKLRLLRRRYASLYRHPDEKNAAQRIVQLRLSRHLGKPWVSEQFPGNMKAMIDQFAQPWERFRLDWPTKYRTLPPLNSSQCRMVESYCGSLDVLGGATWLCSRSKKVIVSACIADLQLGTWDCSQPGKIKKHVGLRPPPQPSEIKQQALLRLLYDVRSEQLMPYLRSWINCETPCHENLQFCDPQGEPAKYPFLEMAVQYGELNVKPLAKNLAAAPAENVPDDLVERYAELLRRIYGTGEKDLLLAEGLLKLHGSNGNVVPSNIQRCIRALQVK